MPSRRSALTKLLWGSLAAFAAPGFYIAARFLIPPARRRVTAVVGREGDIDPGTERIIKVDTTDAILMRDQSGAFVALSLRCTHAGCTVQWNRKEKIFHCPCHRGTFDSYGAVLGGPPKKPLDRLEVRVEDNLVTVINGLT